MRFRVAATGLALLTVLAVTGAIATGPPAQAGPTLCGEQTGDWRYAWGDPALQHITTTTSTCRAAAPWMILLHGGSWINGDRSGMAPAAAVFYRNGWQVFNVEYRRGADVSWRMQQRDLLRAYSWITARAATFRLDLGRGSVYGFSAGGHMAAWLGNQRPSLTSVITVSGVLQPQRVATDDDGLRPPEPPTTEMHNLHLREIAMMSCDWPENGATDPDCRSRWDNFMPEESISPGSPPVFMLQGELDPVVPNPTPDAYGWHLGRAHVEHIVVHVPDLGHTQRLFLADLHRQWAVVRWVRSQWVDQSPTS